MPSCASWPIGAILTEQTQHKIAVVLGGAILAKVQPPPGNLTAEMGAKNNVGKFGQICDVGNDWGCAGRAGR